MHAPYLLYIMEFTAVISYCKCYLFLCAFAERTLYIFENKNAKQILSFYLWTTEHLK